MNRPRPQTDIEASLTARVSDIDQAWRAPETDVTLLRSELAACRDEITRLRSTCDGYRSELALALLGEQCAADEMHAANLARTRLRQWIDDGKVEWTALGDLLLDMEPS